MLPLFRLLLSLTSVGLITTVLLQFGGPEHLSDAALSTKSTGGALSPDEVFSFRERILSKDKDDRPWDHVYVVNLAHRKDRRDHMSKLADALGINVTFFDAVTTANPVVPWILERLHEDQIAREAFDGPPATYVAPAKWGPGGRLRWREHALSALSLTTPAPSYPLLSTPPPGTLDWPMSWLPHYNYPSNPVGATACTLSHLKVMLTAIANEDKSMLVLEDDIDAEFDLVDRWTEMKRALSAREEGWDMVYLGYQHSFEGYAKPLFHPQLRKSHAPLGTQAYSLSHRGVRRLYNHLTTSPHSNLFLRAIDQELAWGVTHPAHYGYDAFAETDSFKAYSSFPPLTAPGDGTLGSDIGGGAGDEWGGILADSVERRIRRYEGEVVRVPTDEEVKGMLWVELGI